ncbi:MAG TPA: YceI family protein [Chitinophagaceae bacterium]|nr:YceI family protein [Chitinophagaceae bacterium]
MRTIQKKLELIISLFLIIVLIVPGTAFSQVRMGSESTKVVIEGTSNVHDWKMTSNNGSVTGTWTVDGAGVPTGLTNLNFIVNVTTLKSEKGSTMDNNAYKAMASDKYPSIKFTSSSATIQNKGGNSFTVTAPGKLSISSGTKDVTLVANGKVNADKSLSLDGSYKLVTTDYNVKAISIMLGAIKTSANVTIKYSFTAKPQ